MQEKLLDVEIITPQRVLFSGKAVSVSVPGSQSPFQILYNHAPIVSALDLGITKINDENDKTSIYATSSGFTEVRKNQVSILVDTADNAADIVPAEESIKLENFKESLKKSNNNDDILTLNINIDLTENKLKAAEKLKNL